MARYSDSDSENRKKSNKKSKKKSKSKRRSRSSSYDTGRSRDSRRRSRSDSRRRSYSSDRSRRSRSHDERKRRRRSRSEDSYRSKRSYRRSRSRTRSPRRRRSGSRTDSRDDGYYYRHRSRSRSHETSYKKKKRSKKESRSRDRTPFKKDNKQATKTKDLCDDIPGFSEMTPAQQSKLRVQAAFKVAEANPSKASSGRSSPMESAIDQMQKAQVIDDIEDSDFMPTHFSSSRSNKSKETTKLPSWPTNLAEQEDYHEMAIFGNSSALGLDEQTKKEISNASEPAIKRTINWEKRDLKTLAHPNLHISIEEAERRWIDKLNSMRREKLNSIAM